MAAKGATGSTVRKAPPNELRGIVQQIVEHCRPRRVILFGSWARGTAGPDSDADLLVVTDRPAGLDASLRIRRAIHSRLPLDLIVLGAGELRERIDSGDYFLQDAVGQGRVLYERPRR